MSLDTKNYQPDEMYGAVRTLGATTYTGALIASSTASFTGAVDFASTVTGLKRPVVANSGATVALTASQSGSAVLFDRAAGIVYTLPANAPGIYFDFYVTVTVTSNTYKVITATGTELLVGQIVNCDTDTSDAVAIWKSLVATSNISVQLGTAGGNTTGGIKGDWVRFTCLNGTTWNVEGMTLGTGVVATPFATS